MLVVCVYLENRMVEKISFIGVSHLGTLKTSTTQYVANFNFISMLYNDTEVVRLTLLLI